MQAVCIANCRADGLAESAPDLRAIAAAVAAPDLRAIAAAVDGLAESAPDLRAVAAAVDGLAESAPDLVARADRKPCADDELATNRGRDDITTEPRAVDRAADGSAGSCADAGAGRGTLEQDAAAVVKSNSIIIVALAATLAV